jgi:hypothetical protein
VQVLNPAASEVIVMMVMPITLPVDAPIHCYEKGPPGSAGTGGGCSLAWAVVVIGKGLTLAIACSGG